MENKKIYILLATYNGEEYLSEQIDSLLAQTYNNWKLWIHDDYSSDKTVYIIQKYLEEHPDKMMFLDDNIKCGGAKENFSHLLNSIDDDFDYLMFCDQDDVWLENKIDVTLRKMLQTETLYSSKPILVHSDLIVTDSKLNTIDTSMFAYQKLNFKFAEDIKELGISNCITGCTMMINNILFHLSKNIPNEAIMHDWWIGLLCLKNNGIIEFEKKSTILYRQHHSNTVGSIKFNILFILKKLLKTINSIKLLKKQLDYLGVKMNIFTIFSKKVTHQIFRLLS